MDDKDKETFDEWRNMFWTLYLGNSFYTNKEAEFSWEAACKYKQKEIDELKFEIMQIKAERNKAEFELAKKEPK